MTRDRCEAYEPEPEGTVIYRCRMLATEVLPDSRTVCPRHAAAAREAAARRAANDSRVH